MKIKEDILKGCSVIIPSKGRLDYNKQLTLINLPKAILKNTIVVTPPEELEGMIKMLMENNVKVGGIIPIEHSSISELRFKVISKLKRNIIFLDDDFNFHCREYPDTENDTKYLLKALNEKYFSEENIEKYISDMFSWISEKLNSDDFGMVGVGARGGNNFLKLKNIYNTRINGFWGINYNNFKKIGSPDISKISTKEDFYLSLCFLKKGIPTISTSDYAYDTPSGSNAAGGCSTYRSLKKMEDNSRALLSFFPDCVSLVKKPISRWNGLGDEGEFFDVKISWKKAYVGKPITDINGYIEEPARTKENYKK
tara:strand:- start:1383 stop:2315 length:933 start_codon:yes stop_codon:yes gene_type:complete